MPSLRLPWTQCLRHALNIPPSIHSAVWFKWAWSHNNYLQITVVAWQEWNLMCSSAFVAHPHQGWIFCACWDTFLLTTIVKRDYLNSYIIPGNINPGNQSSPDLSYQQGLSTGRTVARLVSIHSCLCEISKRSAVCIDVPKTGQWVYVIIKCLKLVLRYSLIN